MSVAKRLTRKGPLTGQGGLPMVRYGFNIRTKAGQRVDNILILAASLTDAERRLRQMYQQCEIVERRELNVRAALDPTGRRATVTRLVTRAERFKARTQ
jgi:hypothetical protein